MFQNGVMGNEMWWTRVVIWGVCALYFGRGIVFNFRDKEWGYFFGSIWICIFSVYMVLMEFGLVPKFFD